MIDFILLGYIKRKENLRRVYGKISLNNEVWVACGKGRDMRVYIF